MKRLKMAAHFLSCFVIATLLNACGSQWQALDAGSEKPIPAGRCLTKSVKQIDLIWQDCSSNESGFEIERKKGATGEYRKIASIAENTTSFSDTGVEPGFTYFYRIRAYNSTGYSEYADEVCVEIRKE